MFRIGYGYDIHRLVPGNNLILGGIKIPYSLQLKSHSDGDVLLHSITDALLGSLGLRDIGYHFPNTESNYGESSALFLKYANREIIKKNYVISNIDSTIIAEKPKLSPFIENMKKNLSNILNVGLSQISIKATTHDGLGSVGENKAIACQTTLLIRRIN